jgi:hypothetical protein
MRGLTYDTGALIAAEARDVGMWALHDETLARDVRPVVPTPPAGASPGSHRLGSRVAGCR